MPVTVYWTAEPRHLAVDSGGARSASHPSNGVKSTVGSRGPPLVTARQSSGSRSIVEPAVPKTRTHLVKDHYEIPQRFPPSSNHGKSTASDLQL
jgi:hypothetical protein